MKRHHYRSLFFGATILGFLSSATAYGQPSGGAPSAAQLDAEERFKRGIALYHDGDLDGAFVEFSRAHEKSGNYRILYNIAQVETERHHYVAAIDRFSEYLEQGGKDIEPSRRDAVRQEIALLTTRIGTVELVLNIDGAEVFLDGVRQVVPGRIARLRVNGGETQLLVRKKGYEDYSKDLKLAGGEHQQIGITMEEQSGEVATTTTPPSSESGSREGAIEPSYNYTPFALVLAGTALLGGAATVSGVLALSAEKKLKDEFNNFPGDRDAQASRRSTLSTLATVTDVFIVATVVAGGVGLYLLIDPPEEGRSDGTPAITGLVLQPSGMVLSGSF